MNNPYENYKNNSINTMTKGEQLILLFEKAEQRLNIAKTFFEQNKIDEAIHQLNRTRDIFNYLMVCLDKKFEYARDLLELYTFINTEIIKAAGRKDVKFIEGILPIVHELRDTWTQAEKLAKIKK